MVLVPNAPVISNLTSIGFTITKTPDSNPSGTYYSYRLIFGTSVKYVNSLGNLQDTKVFLDVASLTVLSALSNTVHSVSLSAAEDALGTNESSYGVASVAVTYASLPLMQSFTNVFSTTVKATWLANNNPTGTQYLVELTPDLGFIGGIISSGWITTVGYVYANLLPNTTYYSRVKARNSSLVETAYVSLGTVVTSNGPDIVKAVHVTNLLSCDRGMLIEWMPNLEINIISYKVYRSSSPTDDSAYALVGTTPASVLSLIDHVVFSFGIVFYYKVTVIDDGGNESSLTLSNPVQDMTYHSFEEQPFPNVITTVDMIDDETPSGLIDGHNTIYTTLYPYRTHEIQVYYNGSKMMRGVDYTEGPGSQKIVFMDPPDITDDVRVSYLRY